jgi:hypothetical protein
MFVHHCSSQIDEIIVFCRCTAKGFLWRRKCGAFYLSSECIFSSRTRRFRKIKGFRVDIELTVTEEIVSSVGICI